LTNDSVKRILSFRGKLFAKPRFNEYLDFRESGEYIVLELQRLYSLTRQAIQDYDMISDGDRIAVGLSGGKDSLTLLYALAGLRSFYPRKFTLEAITVDLGNGEFDLARIKALCERFSVPHVTVSTQIGKILFEARKEPNPCSLCATLRKGALNKAAISDGCNKIAYAHHRDDLIETMMMSLIYEGRFHTFNPKTYLDRSGLSVIRPLIYAREADIIGFANKYDLPVMKNPCPADGKTKRQYVKLLTNRIEKENPGAAKCMFHAILNGAFDENNPEDGGNYHE